MNVTVTPARLKGTVIPPPSKSQAHRVLIAAALSGGVSRIDNVVLSQDIEATLRCLCALGTGVQREGKALVIHGLGNGIRQAPPCPGLDCGESGSTLRFLIPLSLAICGEGAFAGHGRLMERPQKPYFDLFDGKGIFHEQRDGRITVRGLLPPGEYRLPGNVSSQFVTGLLYALPLLDGDSGIVLTSPLESRGYVDMTLDTLGLFGVCPEAREDGFFIPGNQRYQSRDFAIEADWSQAGFWYAAKLLGSPLDVGGMDPGSAQGDRVVLDHYAKLSGPGDVELDVSDCPDLVPPLAAMAALRAGYTTRLTNAARLRIKESDRLAAVTRVLNDLGADVTEGPDSLTIHGKDCLAGGVKVDGFHDHRIAMMTAAAATRCVKPVTITGAECVAKSYPNFWDEYESLGGKIRKSG